METIVTINIESVDSSTLKILDGYSRIILTEKSIIHELNLIVNKMDEDLGMMVDRKYDFKNMHLKKDVVGVDRYLDDDEKIWCVCIRLNGRNEDFTESFATIDEAVNVQNIIFEWLLTN